MNRWHGTCVAAGWAFLLMGLGGCISPLVVGARIVDPAGSGGVGAYPATRFDSKLLFHDYWNGPGEGRLILRSEAWLAPLTAVDLPLAVATDTLFLPHDLCKSAKSERATARRDRQVAPPATPTTAPAPTDEEPFVMPPLVCVGAAPAHERKLP